MKLHPLTWGEPSPASRCSPKKPLTLSKWHWFADAGMCRTRDEFQIMPVLLVGLYLAHRAGSLSKTEACRLMNVDRAVTGPSYAGGAAEHRLVEIRFDAIAAGIFSCRLGALDRTRRSGIARVEAELRGAPQGCWPWSPLALKTTPLTRSWSATGSSTFSCGGQRRACALDVRRSCHV